MKLINSTWYSIESVCNCSQKLIPVRAEEIAISIWGAVVVGILIIMMVQFIIMQHKGATKKQINDRMAKLAIIFVVCAAALFAFVITMAIIR